MEAPEGMEGMSTHDRFIAAHATLSSVATLLLIPTAIIIKRYTFPNRGWFTIHATLNGIAFALMIASFTIAVYTTKPEFTEPGDETVHHKLGLSVFIITGVQVCLGIISHFTRRKDEGPAARHPLRWVHKFLGLATVVLLYATVWQGFDEWGMTSDAGTSVPLAVKVIFWVLVGLAVAAYLPGVLLGLRKQRNGGEKTRRNSDDKPLTSEARV